jgi:predicted DNA-binding transcriptional regulator YafY
VRFSYVAWSGDETNRFVEPHSLVAAQRYWFLVCWDLDRAAWRTFRVDRMGTLRRTGAQFVPRSLPAPDAAEYVRAVRRDLARRQQGEVVIALPLSRVRELLGRWARDAVAVDDQRTTWPIAAESYQQLLSALVWLPRGVEFELRGSDEFLSFAREWSGRLTRAVG